MKEFPRTKVENISLPRMIIGSNWMLGYSHRTTSADKMIRNRYSDKEAVCALVCAYLEYGVDAMMAPFTDPDHRPAQHLLDGIHMAEEKCGRKVILIDTPIVDMSDTAEGREKAKRHFQVSREIGADICLIHHSSAEKLVNKLTGTMDRLEDYTYMIRENGMVPGLSAHMPELILYADEHPEYDVQTYIQIYNCMGFLMQVEVEGVRRIIENARKPVMSIKSMAAGRCTPYVGITFSYATLRPCDMVTVGAFSPEEAREDIEIAMAAIERRFPDMEKRSSPNLTAALGGAVK